MSKRISKLIAIGVLSVSMLSSNVLIYAEELGASAETTTEGQAASEQEPVQTEAPAPQTEPPAPQTEPPAPQTEPPAPQTEPPAPQTEPPAPQTEPQTQAQTQGQTEKQTQAQTEKPIEISTEVSVTNAEETVLTPEDSAEAKKKQKEDLLSLLDGPDADATMHEIQSDEEVQVAIEGFHVDPSLYPEADVTENTAILYYYLLDEMELNHAAACGVIANVHLESTFNPLALGDGGTSYGICQWHYGRFNSLISFCNEKGLDYNTIEGQLEYLKEELNGGYYQVLDYIRQVPNTAEGAYDAAHYFCVYFESPDQTELRAQQRGNLAKEEYFEQEFERPEDSKEKKKSNKVADIRSLINARNNSKEVGIIGDIRVNNGDINGQEAVPTEENVINNIRNGSEESAVDGNSEESEGTVFETETDPTETEDSLISEMEPEVIPEPVIKTETSTEVVSESATEVITESATETDVIGGIRGNIDNRMSLLDYVLQETNAN